MLKLFSWFGQPWFGRSAPAQVLLDVAFQPLYDVERDVVAPHGIIGQAYDGDELAVDGKMDTNRAGETTTEAQAEGAIEGTWEDYIVPTPFSTDFKYSRFDAKSAQPRDVAKLVADGMLNTPKTVYGGGVVGSTENTEEKM